MAFEQLGDRLQSIIKKVKGQTRLTEKNVYGLWHVNTQI